MCRPIPMVAAALGLSLLRAGSVAAAEQFQFNPPEGTTYVLSVRTTRVTTLGALGKRTEDRETSERVQITRTPDGFSLTGTGISGTLNRDGEKVESPIFKMLTGITVTTEVDGRGQVKSMRGFDQFIRKLQSALPPGVLETMPPGVISEEAMVNRETAEWNGRISSFVGREVKVGDVWKSTERYELPTGGVANYQTTTRIVGREQFNGQDCVRIRFSYTAAAPGTAAALGTTAPVPLLGGTAGAGKKPRGKASAGKTNRTKPRPGTMSITGGGDRLIDPATMLIYAEFLTRTIKMPIDVRGRGKVASTMVEKKQYRYQYE
jgi:hypothetical protein